jgi:hypothetical protein
MAKSDDVSGDVDSENQPRAEAFTLTAVSVVAGTKLVYDIAKGDVLPRLKAPSEALVFLDDCSALQDSPDFHRLLLRFANISVHGMYLERVSLVRPSSTWSFSLAGEDANGSLIRSKDSIEAEANEVISTSLLLKPHSEQQLVVDFKLYPLGGFELAKKPYGEVQMWYRCLTDAKGTKELAIKFAIRVPHEHTPKVKLSPPSIDRKIQIV